MMVSNLNWDPYECKSLALLPELSCYLHNNGTTTFTVLNSTN
jgi:hypothetical protein